MCEKVSVALSTYNGARYLRAQLDSIAKQTRIPDELIICDDCSEDNSVDVALEFQKCAPFCVNIYTNDHNLGYAQNFSKTLGMCSGDIVFMCDQDDVWLPEKINQVLSKFHSEPKTQLLIHDIDYCKNDLTLIGQTKIERMRDVFDLQRDYVVGMATAVRAGFLRLCLPIPDSHGVTHDSWLHQCAVAVGCKNIMSEVLALYRRHDSNATLGSSLNVDYVTTSEHFKNNTSFATNVKTLSSLKEDIFNLADWLVKSKKSIVKLGLVSDHEMECLIAKELNHVRMSKIVAMRRYQRILPAFKLYRMGGYRVCGGAVRVLHDIFRGSM